MFHVTDAVLAFYDTVLQWRNDVPDAVLYLRQLSQARPGELRVVPGGPTLAHGFVMVTPAMETPSGAGE